MRSITVAALAALHLCFHKYLLILAALTRGLKHLDKAGFAQREGAALHRSQSPSSPLESRVSKMLRKFGFVCARSGMSGGGADEDLHTDTQSQNPRRLSGGGAPDSQELCC